MIQLCLVRKILTFLPCVLFETLWKYAAVTCTQNGTIWSEIADCFNKDLEYDYKFCIGTGYKKHEIEVNWLILDSLCTSQPLLYFYRFRWRPAYFFYRLPYFVLTAFPYKPGTNRLTAPQKDDKR